MHESIANGFTNCIEWIIGQVVSETIFQYAASAHIATCCRYCIHEYGWYRPCHTLRIKKLDSISGGFVLAGEAGKRDSESRIEMLRVGAQCQEASKCDAVLPISTCQYIECSQCVLVRKASKDARVQASLPLKHARYEIFIKI